MNSKQEPQFTLEQCSLAIMLGHPTVSYYYAAEDVMFNVCPTPMLGLNDDKYTVFYQCILIGPKEIIQDQTYVATLINCAVRELNTGLVHAACGLAKSESLYLTLVNAEIEHLTPATSSLPVLIYTEVLPHVYLDIVQHFLLQSEAISGMLEKFNLSQAKSNPLQSTTH